MSLFISVDEIDEGIKQNTQVMPFSVPQLFVNNTYNAVKKIAPENFEEMLGKIERGDENDAVRRQVFDMISVGWFDNEIQNSIAKKILKFPEAIAEQYFIPSGKGTEFKKEDIVKYGEEADYLFLYGPSANPKFFMLARPTGGPFLSIQYVASDLLYENRTETHLGVWRRPPSRVALSWDGTIDFTVLDVYNPSQLQFASGNFNGEVLPKSSEMIVKRLKRADDQLIRKVFGTITVPKNTILYNASKKDDWQCTQQPYPGRGSFFAGEISRAITGHWGEKVACFKTELDVPRVLNLLQPPKGTFVETTPSIFDFKPYWTGTRWFLRQLIFSDYAKYDFNIYGGEDADVAFFYKKKRGEKINGWISQDSGHLMNGGELMLLDTENVKTLWVSRVDHSFWQGGFQSGFHGDDSASESETQEKRIYIRCEEMKERLRLQKIINELGKDVNSEISATEKINSASGPYAVEFYEIIRAFRTETTKFRTEADLPVPELRRAEGHLRETLRNVQIFRTAFQTLMRFGERMNEMEYTVTPSSNSEMGELFEQFPINRDLYKSQYEELERARDSVKESLKPKNGLEFTQFLQYVTELEQEAFSLEKRLEKFVKQAAKTLPEKQPKKKRSNDDGSDK